MSILINGMEMPISCEKCPMLDWDLDYIKCKITGRHFKMTECWRSIRVPDCPLVPVPKHGRLIDADVLKRNIAANLPAAFQDFSAGLCFIVDMQRTVIESELEG